MSTDSRGRVSQFDFEELANQLMEQGLAASPADLHGCLSGLLASGTSHEAEAGIAGLNQALDMDLHGELAEQIMALYVATALSMENDDLDFYPLLLDDSADIGSRVSALADWCRSFVAGYVQMSSFAADQQPALPGDSSEILRDLAAIAEADVVDLVEDEESEKNYAELTEYVRFAVLNAYADSNLRNADNLTPDSGEPQLH